MQLDISKWKCYKEDYCNSKCDECMQTYKEEFAEVIVQEETFEFSYTTIDKLKEIYKEKVTHENVRDYVERYVTADFKDVMKELEVKRNDT